MRIRACLSRSETADKWHDMWHEAKPLTSGITCADKWHNMCWPWHSMAVQSWPRLAKARKPMAVQGCPRLSRAGQGCPRLAKAGQG